MATMMGQNYALSVFIEADSSFSKYYILELESCIRAVLSERIGFYDLDSDNDKNSAPGEKNISAVPIIFQIKYLPNASNKVEIKACRSPLKSVVK